MYKKNSKMKIEIPKISSQINNEDVENALESNYNLIVDKWFYFQTEWLNKSYVKFKDHDKNLIYIYLVQKTLDFYAKHFTKLSMDEYYSKVLIDIEKFTVIDIARDLQISKETTRRKILEFEEQGILQRRGKNLNIDRSAYGYKLPNVSIKNISSVLNVASTILFKNKILNKSFSAIEIEKSIIKNFSYAWKFFLEMQISNLTRWKNVFKNLETFHIFGICVANEQLHLKKTLDLNLTPISRMNYLEKIPQKQKMGINAMSISDMTGIPRATVVRKLLLLVKNKILYIDKKKLYHVNPDLKHYQAADNAGKSFSIFSTKIFNLIVL